MWALGLQEMPANESDTTKGLSAVKPGVTQPPPLSQIFLSLQSQPAKLKAINHAMQTLRVLCCREFVSSAIKSKESTESVSLEESSHFMADVENNDESFEMEAQLVEAQKKAKIMEKMAGIQPETITSVDQLGMSTTDIRKKRTRSQVSKSISFLSPESIQPFMQSTVHDCNSMINFLRLVIPSPSACSYKNVMSQALSTLARSFPTVADSVVDSCVSILEEIIASPADANSSSEQQGSNSVTLMQPVIQESDHPYRTESHSAGVVTIPGAKSLRIQFDFKCYTEPSKDILTLMDGQNNIIEHLSGRVYKDWNAEICVIGDTLKWRFSATSNLNFQASNAVDEGRHWGWCFMVFPSPGGGGAWSKGSMSPMGLSHHSNALMVSDRQALSQPCFEVAKHLLDNNCLIVSMVEQSLVAKLALALASCAQLSYLGKFVKSFY